MKWKITLTQRETQIAELLAWGAAKKEVADKLDISPRTVENTARNIYQKLSIQKATELSVWWFCTHCGVSMDLSPFKQKIIAIFFLSMIIPFEFYNSFDSDKCLRTRRVQTSRRAPGRKQHNY